LCNYSRFYFFLGGLFSLPGPDGFPGCLLGQPGLGLGCGSFGAGFCGVLGCFAIMVVFINNYGLRLHSDRIIMINMEHRIMNLVKARILNYCKSINLSTIYKQS
jgi:hypothetical protein